MLGTLNEQTTHKEKQKMEENPSCAATQRHKSMPNDGMAAERPTVSDEVFNLVDPATGTIHERSIVIDTTVRQNTKSEVAA